MRRILWIAIVLGVAAVLLVLSREGPRNRTGTAPVGDSSSHGSVSDELVVPELSPSADPMIEADRAAGTEGTSRVPAPAERVRIAGRVEVAGGLSDPDSVRVVAEIYRGRVNAGPPRRVEAPVGTDGSFSFEIPSGTRYALLDVESSFLYLAEAVKALPGAREVVLRPEAFALLEGRVELPFGKLLPDGTHTWASVDVRLDSNEVFIHPDEAGAFEFSFVPVDRPLRLRVSHPYGPDQEIEVAPLRPAERRFVVVALEPGLVISGRVIDENGNGVEGVSVFVRRPQDSHSGRSTKTRGDGSFELGGLTRESLIVSTSGDDIAEEAQVVVDGRRGDARGLLLKVSLGKVIEGMVEWSDGTPAKAVQIQVHGEQSQFWRHADQPGRFVLRALANESYRLNFESHRPGVQGTAEISSIRPGGAPLRVVLEEVPTTQVRGTVVDAAGKPVESFTVGASRPSEGSFDSMTSGDGSFTLTGLVHGDWTIEIEAPGYDSASQRITLPSPQAGDLRFVLGPAAEIVGRVIDPRGDPVGGASVCTGGWIWFNGKPFDDDAKQTDSQGVFCLQARSGDIVLCASKPGFGPSPAERIQVQPGQRLEGVVLRLREPCRLEGEVFDPDGEPVAGARVQVTMEEEANPFVRTDSDGRFELEDLPEGAITVTAFPEVRSAGFPRVRQTAILLAGRTTRVELRLPRLDVVRLRGKVSWQGEATSAWIFLEQESGSFASCFAGPSGEFDVKLPHPGRWQGAIFLVRARDLSEMIDSPLELRLLEVEIPDVEEHELEIAAETLPVVEAGGEPR